LNPPAYPLLPAPSLDLPKGSTVHRD